MHKSILLFAENTSSSGKICQLFEEYEIYQCTTVADGEVLCRKHAVTLVLIAEKVNGHDGCTLFHDLRKQCPVISGLLLAGTEDNGLLRRAMDSGISGLIELPFDPDQLKYQVSRAMDAALLRRENERLHTLLPLYSLGEQLLSSTTEDEVLAGLLDEVVRQTGAGHVSVMLFDAEEACLRIAAARGMDRELVQSIRIRPGDQIAGWVFQQGKPVILNRDTQEESIFAPLLKRTEIASAISFPLIVRGDILGVLNISRTAEDVFFSESDKEMLGIICGQAALALENVRSLEMAKKTTRMRTLFEQYVAPEVAEILLAGNTDIMGLGEIKEATVLFADIRNFTSLVQHLELSDLRIFLNEFFQVFTDTIFQHSGTVDKFMGDAVLAVFGAPVQLENAGRAAVRTALLLRERFEALRSRWAEHVENFQTVDLGIAVTSGRMYIGNVGSNRRLDYTVIGTPVNIAQRLAAESSQCRIYVTAPVREAVCGDIATEDVGNLLLRGVEQRVKVFSV
jgi:adenylate cyclase